MVARVEEHAAAHEARDTDCLCNLGTLSGIEGIQIDGHSAVLQRLHLALLGLSYLRRAAAGQATQAVKVHVAALKLCIVLLAEVVQVLTVLVLLMQPTVGRRLGAYAVHVAHEVVLQAKGCFR